MESSSVYMCFPCYREFPTLEEVLTHQLTCTAESTEPLPAGTPMEAAVAAGLQESVAVSEMVEGVVEEDETVISGADVPRVLYQCADCELLFDALSLWQQHRKMGCCQETGPGPGEEQAEATESMLEPLEQSESENTDHREQEEAEGGGEHQETMETSVQGNEALMERNPEEAQSGIEHPEPDAPPAAESVEEQSPPVRRRGQKKAKPPSSLLCVECGQCFSLVSELVAHRKTAHGLKDAIHRCTVCGEGFINTTLYLYHRKQHRTQVEEEQMEPPPPVPQLNTALLEAPGEGLLLLATAGEGQSLLEITSLEQTISEAVPVAHVEVELDPERARGDEGHQSAQEPEETVEECRGEMEIDGIVNMEMEEATEEEEEEEDEDGKNVEEVVEENQVNLEANDAHEVHNDANDVAPPFTTSSGGQSFLCSQCGSSFKGKYEFVQHRSTEHGLMEAVHTCTECGEEFMSTTQFLYHRREHRRDFPEGLPSSPGARHGLGQIFTSPAKQRDIILLRRSESGQAQSSAEASSPLPDTNIEAPAKLSRDWSRTPLPHECPHCGRGFTRRCLLREHVFHHTGEKLFNCHICKKSFPSPASLLRHSMTHGASRAFSCPICAKGFFQPTSLKRHMLTHEEADGDKRIRVRGRGKRSLGDGRLHACPDCPASFKLDSQLQTHRLLHTSHPFPCNVCGEAFKRRKELDLHSLIHQGFRVIQAKVNTKPSDTRGLGGLVERQRELWPCKVAMWSATLLGTRKEAVWRKNVCGKWRDRLKREKATGRQSAREKKEGSGERERESVIFSNRHLITGVVFSRSYARAPTAASRSGASLSSGLQTRLKDRGSDIIRGGGPEDRRRGEENFTSIPSLLQSELGLRESERGERGRKLAPLSLLCPPLGLAALAISLSCALWALFNDSLPFILDYYNTTAVEKQPFLTLPFKTELEQAPRSCCSCNCPLRLTGTAPTFLERSELAG
ncbi:hypothetical protein SRHO_G00061610 [Serrasalmus rhombeus]